MKELLRSNDVILINWLQVLLKNDGIDTVVFDEYTSVMEGSLGAIQRHIMVSSNQYLNAWKIIKEAGKADQLD